MNLTNRLRELLGELNRNPAQVLRTAGAKGRRGDCTNCVVARWLSQKLEHPVSVTPYVADCLEETGHSVPLPLSVSYFVSEFDRGSYPDLVL